ncbi:MAG: hypothetical protein WHV44_10315, partial [Anaerolineales bacterium]
ENVAPMPADVNAVYTPQPTPVIATTTPTPIPPTLTPVPSTRTPLPEVTLPPVTPQTETDTTEASAWLELASLGVFAILLLVVGLRRFVRRTRR